ncbi:MAG: hypothetical protein GY739_02280 [Mesoflavibacter sp.]|nr:hypothetical protein [Mesoflavibacter sp.]
MSKTNQRPAPDVSASSLRDAGETEFDQYCEQICVLHLDVVELLLVDVFEVGLYVHVLQHGLPIRIVVEELLKTVDRSSIHTRISFHNHHHNHYDIAI